MLNYILHDTKTAVPQVVCLNRCPACAIQMGQATYAIWVAIKNIQR